jgi:uncharacterized phage-associated protein
MEYPFDFDTEKAIEAILYIAKHTERKKFFPILKLLYIADKEHLEKYGRFICGDKYIAMKDGPVPSGVYDLIKFSKGESLNKYHPRDINIDNLNEAFIISNNKVQNQREPDLDVLSISDLECLNKVIREHGHKSDKELKELTHDNSWTAVTLNEPIGIEAITKDFVNATDLLAHLSDPHPGSSSNWY